MFTTRTVSCPIRRFSVLMAMFLTLLTFGPSTSVGNVDQALQHEYEIMDKYHSTFDVYTDIDAGGNHFNPSGWMGDRSAISFDSGWTSNCHSGRTSIRISFTANGNNWAGVYWQEPEDNWGTDPHGYDLSGATTLVFWARGHTGGEQIEFFMGGITGSYPDTAAKTSTGFVTLTSSWRQYTINVSSKNLSRVVGGFGWATSAVRNPGGVTFYVDDIQYTKSRLDEARFLLSYEIPASIEAPGSLRNACCIYDNALALLSFLARGHAEDLTRARIIADALIYAQNNDRYYDDGRLRNAYMSGDMADHVTGKARLPRWWDPEEEQWREDEFHVSTDTGNMAWATMALLSSYESTGDSRYLLAAQRIGEWIYSETTDTRGPGGYTGGYTGWELDPEKILWKSTKHNIAVYAAFMQMYRATDNAVWRERALRAKEFAAAMWNNSGGHFWTGTMNDGNSINYGNIPVDIQAWGVLGLHSYSRSLAWASNNCYVEADGFKGFDYNNDRDGIWFEGTAQMAGAFRIVGTNALSDLYLSELRNAQASAANGNGKGIVAASHDGVSTGFDTSYDSRLHIGATAWYILAETGYNPLQGQDGLPYDMNWDGFRSIIGDVPPFVRVVYFNDYDWYAEQFAGRDPTVPGDCNSDGILSIVGDVPCFVDCVYLENCPE
jgi:hypothetical protein